jgi:hypothetical protein
MLRIATPTVLNDEVAVGEDAALLCPVWGTIRNPNDDEILNILGRHDILNRTGDNRGINPDPDGEDAEYWQEYVNLTVEITEIYLQQEGGQRIDLRNPQVRYTPEETTANQAIRRLYFEIPQPGNVGHFIFMIDPNDINNLIAFINLVRGHQVLIQRNAYQPPILAKDITTVPPMIAADVATPASVADTFAGAPPIAKADASAITPVPVTSPVVSTLTRPDYRRMIRQQIKNALRERQLVLEFPMRSGELNMLGDDADFAVFVDIILSNPDQWNRTFLTLSSLLSMSNKFKFGFIAQGNKHTVERQHIGATQQKAKEIFRQKQGHTSTPIHEYTITSWKDMPEFQGTVQVKQDQKKQVEQGKLYIPFKKRKQIKMVRFFERSELQLFAKGLVLMVTGDIKKEPLIKPYDKK